MTTKFKLGAGAEKFTCPYCNTPFKEGDEAISCPECKTLHHAVCWEENKGCATVGCSKQHYKAQDIPRTDVCPNCDETSEKEQNIYPKYEISTENSKNSICCKCGTELQKGQEFCPKCGQKAELQTAANNVNQKKGKKAVKIIIAAAAAVIIIAVCAAIFAPKIFVSVDELCAQGNYEKAYTKADEDKKLDIRAENAVAVQSALSAENLKDPDSFQLREAYYFEYHDGGKQIVLYISAKNGFGATVGSYWLYNLNSEVEGWRYWGSVSDLDKEEYSVYDDKDERSEKEMNNLCRVFITQIMKTGLKLSKDAVKRINTMFEAGTLENVKLLPTE